MNKFDSVSKSKEWHAFEFIYWNFGILIENIYLLWLYGPNDDWSNWMLRYFRSDYIFLTQLLFRYQNKKWKPIKS